MCDFKILAPNGVVKNSDESFVAGVPSGGEYTLPDIQITDYKGDVTPWPSVKNYQQPELPIMYNYPAPTGQLIEYATYDDRWQEVNVWAPARAAQSPYGRKPRLSDFYTLIEPNAFGNTRRFTLINGNEPALNTAGQYIIDHYTGLGHITGQNPDGVQRTFVNELVYVESLVFAGFDDWRIITAAMQPMHDYGAPLVGGLYGINRYEPAGFSKLTCTSSRFDPSQVFIIRNNSNTLFANKISSSAQWGIYRRHY